MGFLDDRVSAAQLRQKQSLLEEAAKSGARVVQVIEGSQTGIAGVVGSTLTSLFGGDTRVDGLQLLQLDTGGWTQLYAQPFAGMQPVPGEHHALLSGSLAAPIVLRNSSRFGAPRWECPQLPELAAWLAANPALAAATKAIEWSWKAGFTEIRLPWAAQLRSVGDGTSHLVMMAARYGGVITYEVGFAVWRQLAAALAPCLGAVQHPPQAFLEPSAFTETFGALVARDWRAGGSAPTATQSLDYSASIYAALQPWAGKRVYMGNIPTKQEANLRTKVLPPAHARDPIVAAIDLTAFGSAADAIVFTPTHLFAKDIDQRVDFELAALESATSAGMLGGRFDLSVAGLGRMALSIGAADRRPIEAVLGAIVQQNQGGARTDEVGAKINAAAQLMTSGRFAECIEAYTWIGHQHPDHAATCHSQIGAAHYFLGNYAIAISHYEYARSIGADPRMMDDNIREAQQALGRA